MLNWLCLQQTVRFWQSYKIITNHTVRQDLRNLGATCKSVGVGHSSKHCEVSMLDL